MKKEKVILIDDMEIYQLGMKIGNNVWNFVDKWDNWLKATIGKQLVRAADSIAATFSEGYGRYTYKDRRNLCYISRGSMFETRTWLTKAHRRNIITETAFNSFMEELRLLHLKLNSYISSLNKNIKPQE
jgi:four helix bundle protein